VFWFRTVLALAIGVGAGVLQLTGVYVIVGFFVALLLLSYVYYNRVLEADDEDFPNNELFMEAFGNSFATFMVRPSVTAVVVDPGVHLRLT